MSNIWGLLFFGRKTAGGRWAQEHRGFMHQKPGWPAWHGSQPSRPRLGQAGKTWPKPDHPKNMVLVLIGPLVAPNQVLTGSPGRELRGGAAGGVGSISVRLLLNEGYEVAAVSGHDHGKALLRELGVKQILDREEAVDSGNRPLLKPQWNGVIDNVGGIPLATALKTTKPGGVITTCGNVAGAELSTTVFPFILRGLRLIGIDSQNCPYALRKQLWQHLATDWKLQNLKVGLKEVAIEGMLNEIESILRSEVKGRVVLRHKAAE